MVGSPRIGFIETILLMSPRVGHIEGTWLMPPRIGLIERIWLMPPRIGLREEVLVWGPSRVDGCGKLWLKLRFGLTLDFMGSPRSSSF